MEMLFCFGMCVAVTLITLSAAAFRNLETELGAGMLLVGTLLAIGLCWWFIPVDEMLADAPWQLLLNHLIDTGSIM